MRAGIYIRVSTLEQAQEGYSLAAQEEKLRAYAAFQGYELAESAYMDDGYSASSLSRPALLRLVDDVRSGKIDIVLIYKLDRLSRRVKDVLELVELFQQYGVTLFSLTENLDLSSPFGRAALKMSATFSELERETIIERTKLGRDQRVRQGRMLFTGKPPFGYIYDLKTKRFEIVEKEAEMVRKLFDLYIGGSTFRKLYDYARTHFEHPYFSNPMCCKPILKRIMYAGLINYKGEIYEGTNFQPIIDYQTFHAAQKQIEKNRVTRKHDNSPYLLTGLLFCAHCGNRYVGKLYARKKTEYRYTAYGCAARVKRDRRHLPAHCKNKIYTADVLEQAVEKAVGALTLANLPDFAPSQDISRRLEEENSAAKKQMEKLIDLYLGDLLAKDACRARVQELQDLVKKNNDTMQAVQNARATAVQMANPVEDMLVKFGQKSKKTKRVILGLFIENISIDNDHITIKWKFQRGGNANQIN